MLLNSRKLRNVQQSEIAECGLACILIFVNYFAKKNIPLPLFRKKYPTSTEGMSASEIVKLARSVGLEAKVYETDSQARLEKLTPFIAYWEGRHFVIVKKVKNGSFYILDPAHGERKIRTNIFKEKFSRILFVLSVADKKRFFGIASELSDKRADGWIKFLTGLRGAVLSIVAIIFLGGAVEAMGLLLPVFTKEIVDGLHNERVSITTDLYLIAGGFILICLAQATLLYLRFSAITKLSSYFNRDWTRKIFSHLLSLSTLYFQRRHVADVVSRINTIETIQKTIAVSFVSSFLDGVMSLAGIILLAMYSGRIALIVFTSFIIYTFIRLITFRRSEMLSNDRSVVAAELSGEIYESIRGINSIKLAAKEGNRLERYMTVKCAGQILEIKSQSLLSVIKASSYGLFNAQRVLVLLAGFYLVKNGSISVGSLMACVAYAEQFINRAPGLVDKIADLTLLKVQLSRLNDILYNDPEMVASGCRAERSGNVNEGEFLLEAQDIGFKYASGKQWLFRHINISLSKGGTMIITGGSGRGKSTLAKILVGLIEPTEGDVHINGVPIREFGLTNYRNLVSGVIQNDQLFAGTVSENIAFFDNDIDTERVIQCARAANIYEDIEVMPMKFETFLNGASNYLSGGQCQRIYLARALYKNPSLLMLDEATSHLDFYNRNTICEMIAGLKVAKIIVTHIDVENFPNADIIDLDSVCVVDQAKRLAKSKGAIYA